MFASNAKPNGTMPVQFGKFKAVVTGGPYRARIPEMVGVKMAEEINAPCDISIPTRDFSVPDPEVFRKGVMLGLMQLIAGRELYVGCMGGIGRTGLYLGGLACVMREYQRLGHRSLIDPVKYVREHYIPHAIETRQQQEFLGQIDWKPTAEWVKMTLRLMDFNAFEAPTNLKAQVATAEMAEDLRNELHAAVKILQEDVFRPRTYVRRWVRTDKNAPWWKKLFDLHHEYEWVEVQNHDGL